MKAGYACQGKVVRLLDSGYVGKRVGRVIKTKCKKCEIELRSSAIEDFSTNTSSRVDAHLHRVRLSYG